jgi:hypothetical protein
MTVTLAQAVDRLGSGPYRDVSFTNEQLRELRYAGLLHDFGKVGVREQVLVKEKKLYPHDLDLIRHRFAFLDQRTELEFERARAELLLTGGRAAYEAGLARLECERRKQREELARFLDTVVQANEPTVLAEGSFEALEAIGQRSFVDFDGRTRPLLEDHELQFLMIRRGKPRRAGAARDRVARHAHLPLPRADSLDARAARHPADRVRAPREAERARLPNRARRRDPRAGAHHDDRRHLRRAHARPIAVQARRAARPRARHPRRWKRRRARSTPSCCRRSSARAVFDLTAGVTSGD